MATKASTSATSKSPLPLLQRDEYGALQMSQHLQAAQIEEVRGLLKKAESQEDGLPAEYVKRGKSDFECLNHDVYDVVIVRGKVRGLIVQTRWFWKHLRKTRTRITKSYYLVTAVRNKVTVKKLENATCAKRAKNTSKLGQLSAHYLGKITVRCTSPLSTISTAFKVLAKTGDDCLCSAFDGSEYNIGAWRAETARPNHGGGYYCYLDQELAKKATELGSTFHKSVSDGKRLVLCEVEISGKRVVYNGGKLAVSRLRVMREVREITLCGAN